MSADTNKSPKDYLPFGCLGALCFFFGLFIALYALSGEVKKDKGAVWVLVVLLLGLGGAGLFAAWKVWKKEKAARPKARSEAPTPSARPIARPITPTPSPIASLPPPPPGEVRCPSCGHVFVPPRITLTTHAITARYGPKPVQCPECKHIWGRP